MRVFYGTCQRVRKGWRGGWHRRQPERTAEGLDACVTGEAVHGIYHHCLQGRIHAMLAGHYHSESFGVRALAERLAQETGLATTYLDVPTGL